MRLLFLVSILFTATSSFAQFAPKWAVLEKQNSVGVIKPGANDIMYYMGAKMRTMDKAAFDDLNSSLSFKAGSAVLITGKANEDHIATDIEGRTLVIKGPITEAAQGKGSGVGYLKEDIEDDGVTLSKGMYVWLKNTDAQKGTASVQFAGGKTVKVPLSKFYIIDATTAEMAATIPFKSVE